VAFGVGYLRYLDDTFGRRSSLAPGLATVPVRAAGERRLFAIAAYNAGEGRVVRAQARAAAAGGDPTRFADVRLFLPGTTQGYVERVVGYARAEAPRRRWASGYASPVDFAGLIRALPSGRGEVQRERPCQSGWTRSSIHICKCFRSVFAARCPG